MTADDIARLRKLLAKYDSATHHVDAKWHRRHLTDALIPVLPALLDAAEEAGRLREALQAALAWANHRCKDPECNVAMCDEAVGLQDMAREVLNNDR